MDQTERTTGIPGAESAGKGSLESRDGAEAGGDAAAGTADSTPDYPVVEGKIHWLSVSAVGRADHGQYGGCRRRWWYRYVGHKREPQSAAAGKGEKMHANLAAHLLTGERLRGNARIAARLCSELRLERLGVEQPFAGGLVADGVPFRGKIDVVRWDHNQIIDWKRTTEEETQLLQKPPPAKSVQMVGYGKWYLNAVPAAQQIDLTLAYMKAGWLEPLQITSATNRQYIDDRWGAVETVVRLMKQDAQVTSPEDVPANKDSCDAYGGCPHVTYCTAGRQAIGVTRVSLGEELRKRKAEKKQQSVSPPDAPKSGEKAPKAEPMSEEELKAQPPEIQAAVAAVEHPQITAVRLECEGEFTKAWVERTVNLGDYNNVRAGLEMALKGCKDPQAPLTRLVDELDAFSEAYRERTKK